MITMHTRQRRHQEAGTIIVFAAFAMLLVFGFAALSVGVAHVYQQMQDMQSATDAAALAAAGVLTNSSATASEIRTEALAIARTNGITDAEISASNFGTIEVGQWDGSFHKDVTPYNAVLVGAKRSVDLLFGKVVGFAGMSPTIHSVAMQSYPNQAVGLAPFMLTSNFVNAPFGTVLDLQKKDEKVNGDFGQAHVPGTPSGSGEWVNQMADGCGCTVTTGESINGTTGNDHTQVGLAAVDGEDVVMPVVPSVPSNTGAATVLGFVVVHVDVVNDTGNWEVKLTLLSAAAGTGTGGTNAVPYAKDRILVE